MFPDPVIQQKKLAMLGLAGALGNVLGLLLAGVCMLANYRWFFRVVGIIAIVSERLDMPDRSAFARPRSCSSRTPGRPIRKRQTPRLDGSEWMLSVSS